VNLVSYPKDENRRFRPLSPSWHITCKFHAKVDQKRENVTARRDHELRRRNSTQVITARGNIRNYIFVNWL
jgi:hypothetical protein